MENDSVRTIGDSTLVDLWIAGKLRGISVSRGAIESFLRIPPGRGLSDDERSDFVRTHLALVMAAAASKIDHGSAAAGDIAIEARDLAAQSGGPSADRRRGGDRRKGDRRKVDRGAPGGIERRES